MTGSYTSVVNQVKALADEFRVPGKPYAFSGANFMTNEIVSTFRINPEISCELSIGIGIGRNHYILGVTFAQNEEQVAGRPSQAVFSIHEARELIAQVRDTGIEQHREEQEYARNPEHRP